MTLGPQTPAAMAPAGRRVHRVLPSLWLLLTSLVVLFWLAPVLWMFNISLKTRAQIAVPVPTFLFRPTLENYTAIFQNGNLVRYAMNSLIIASVTTVITVLLAALSAYGLARFTFRGREGLLTWILSLRMMPAIAVVVPFYIMYQRLGLLDTYPGIVLAYLPVTLPFAIWLLYSFIRDIPIVLDEAAMLDGCGPWRTFLEIVFPVSLPSVAVTAIFTFIVCWNEFLLALILTANRAKTLAVGMSEFILSYEVLWGQISAAAIVMLLPLLVLVYLVQRHIVKGMTLGAVR